MANHRFLWVLLLLFSTACSSRAPVPTDTPAAVVQPTRAATRAPTSLSTLAATDTLIPIPSISAVFAIGEIAQFNQLELAVVKVALAGDQLNITLAARNSGTTPSQYINPAQMRLTQLDGTALKISQCAQSAPVFSGYLQPGDTLNGMACFTGAFPDGKLHLEYHDLSGRPLAAWDLSAPGDAPVPQEMASPALQGPLHNLGEGVPYGGLTITLDGFTVKLPDAAGPTPTPSVPTGITATPVLSTPTAETVTAAVTKTATVAMSPAVTAVVRFIFENKGSSDANLSKDLVGSVEVKAADGEKLSPTLQGLGCDVPPVDDILIKPGKNVTVALCFTTTGDSPQPGGRVILVNRSDAGQFDFINWDIR